MGSETSTFGPFVLDRRREELTRDGVPVPIGHRGFLLLQMLVDAAGETVGKSALMEAAWPGTIVEEGNLTVQVAALRKALNGEGSEDWIVTVPRVGYRLPRPAAAPEPTTGGGRPLVAVLPFANLSNEAEQGYFADGVVEDIITALSRFKQFAVVSRSSSFVHAGRDAREAGKALGVRYLLEGSVRRSAERLRVTAQLVDTETGADLWAEKFDGAAADIFEFQDRITENVVGLIEPEIRKAEIQRARRNPPENLDAYELFLQALPLVYGMDPDGYSEAIELLDKARGLDPAFALAPTYMAWCYEKRSSLSLPPTKPDDWSRGVTLARSALAAGGSDPLVRAICGWVLFALGREVDTGLAAVRQARAANPNNIVVLTLAGAANVLTGGFDEAYECYYRAYRLSPGAPDAFWGLTGMAFAELFRGNYDAAISWCKQSLATFNDWPFTYYTLVAAYVRLGRMEEARSALQRLRAISPHLTGATLRTTMVGWTFLALADWLTEAGLPER